MQVDAGMRASTSAVIKTLLHRLGALKCPSTALWGLRGVAPGCVPRALSIDLSFHAEGLFRVRAVPLGAWG